ncbi:hypothetical protein BV25DRAFT_176137 [Artomyces pyxidatus]|uniref:Uncharacterized protein n=1 Tax=Artomyces pyxidatus TaxID=48021 RepID=A0ACB8SI27_9AGAM|nr:hypothetical protein BV25DRAFT_176137 [Artomyces pyxidatus]
MRLIPKIFRRKKTRREPVDEPDYAEDHRMSPVPSAHILPESEFGMEMGGVHDPEDDDSPENHAGVGTASHRDLDRVTEVDYNHGRQHEPPRERDTRSYRRRREDDYGRRRSRSRSRSKGRNRTRKLVIPDIVVHRPFLVSSN